MPSRSWTRRIRIAITCLLVVSQTTLAIADGPIQAKFTSWIKGHGKRPVTARDGRLEELAANVDWLEHHLNLWGAVSAKAPDVWGEARLTEYRFLVEKKLAEYEGGFTPDRISGAQSVSDQAMLAAALSIQANNSVQAGQSRVTAPPIQIQSTTGASNPGSSTTNITLPNDFSPKANRLSFTESDKSFLGQSFGLEQTQVLDELNRYLQHLNQLRRINEGDDTSDAPGYAMNLIRVPVSILPGTLSKRGYGAEITMTAKPYLGPELLPMTFRDLVTNDLIDQLAVPLAKFLNSNPGRADRLLHAYEVNKNQDRLLSDFNRRYGEKALPLSCGVLNIIHEVNDSLIYFRDGKLSQPILSKTDVEAASHEIELISDRFAANGLGAINEKSGDDVAKGLNDFAKKSNVMLRKTNRTLQSMKSTQALESIREDKSNGITPRPAVESDPNNAVAGSLSRSLASDAKQSIEQELSEVFSVIEDLNKVGQLLSSVWAISVTSSSSRRSQLPFPPTQLIDVFGLDEMTKLVLAALAGFRVDLPNKRVVHVTDCKAFLRDEVSAAFSLLYADTMREWWECESTGQHHLHDLIRMRQTDRVADYRHRFIEYVQATGGSDITASLAWCAFVDSILLNERLIEDIRENAGNRPNAPQIHQWIAFFGPDPSMEARLLFADYTANRWPLRIFALDPMVDQQNIGDVSSIYRQMQFALVLGVSGGDIGLSTAMQTMRKLQRDRATIDLNRTAIGFGQGDNTFGWRFQPRFQTPPVEGNAKVFFRDLIAGGPTDRQLERSVEIEPGMRECTAVVLMPSFVPFVSIETRSQWYKLAAPGHVAQSIKDDVEMSRAVQDMKTRASECSLCTHLYREGEVERVLSRVEQLEKRLPMQTIACQVPTENTFGGFEILSSGTRALAPELLGWYGAPGYDIATGGSFFLSGDNFSIKQTKLVVGNQVIHPDNIKLLSRQVIQVVLPPKLALLPDTLLRMHNPQETFRGDEDRFIAEDQKYGGYLDAHLATPYGISNHLLIPVLAVPSPPPAPNAAPANAPPGFQLLPGVLRLNAKFSKVQTIPGELLSIQPVAPMMPAIKNPQTVGLTTTPRDVNLYLTHDQSRFAPIQFKQVRFESSPGAYQIGADQLQEYLQRPSGDLFKLIENYLKYLLANNFDLKDGLSFQASYTIENEGAEIPVIGKFEIIVFKLLD